MTDIYTSRNSTEFEKIIGYTYSDKSLLENALTHTSYCNEKRTSSGIMPSNERLEFLGDSVLSVIVSDYIYKNYPDLDEGDLTRIRAAVVCENTLAEFAKSIKLGEFIKLGHGEASTHGRERKSILSDAYEAVIASVYLDGGIENAERFVLPRIINAVKVHLKKGTEDYKSHLQRIAQETPEEILEYVLVEETGPAHDRRFTIQVRLNSNVLGTGVGKTKREAEQNAAMEALTLFPDENS